MLRKIILVCFLIIISTNLIGKENRVIIASTTSTYDTGFLEYINNIFEKNYNIKIHVLALGTGQAIEVAKEGNVDILLVHHKPTELKFIEDGFGILRHDLMYNEYIIVGPKNNNHGCETVKDFFLIIKNNKLLFISRGDESGTHKKEKELWDFIKYNPETYLNSYKKVGQGMGATLMIANEMNAYTMTDKATWVNFNKKENLKIICQNKPPLLNQYGIIAVNPKLNKNINYEWALKYINWLISKEGKILINNYKKNGLQLFFYNNIKKKDPAS